MLEKVFNAIFLTYDNAVELNSEGDILLNNGKSQRAYTLYHFSFEEGGRFFLLLQTVFKVILKQLKPSELNYKYLAKIGYDKHTKKLDESLLKLFIHPIMNALEKDDANLMALFEFYDKLADKVPEINERKNRSIYICHIDNDFMSPSESITKDDIDSIRFLAHYQLKNMKAMVDVLKDIGTLENLKKFLKDNVTAEMLQEIDLIQAGKLI